MRAGSVALVSLLMLSCDVVDRTEPSIVITNVTVIDATGRPPMADMTVVIAGGRIQRIAAADTVSPIPGTEEVDGSGKYLIPGLWDMHVHLSLYGEASLPALIQNGVTGVLDLGGDLAQLDHWRDEIRNGQRLGPRIYRSGPFVDGYKSNEVSGRLSSTLTVENPRNGPAGRSKSERAGRGRNQGSQCTSTRCVFRVGRSGPDAEPSVCGTPATERKRKRGLRIGSKEPPTYGNSVGERDLS